MKKGFVIGIIAALSVLSGFLQRKLAITEGELKEAQNVSQQVVTVTEFDTVSVVTTRYDTTYIKSTPRVDTVTIADGSQDIVYITDTVYITETISNEGTIDFSDSSNLFTDVNITVPYPSGDIIVRYMDKFKYSSFRLYLGIGVNTDADGIFSCDAYISNFGVGAAISTEGTIYGKASLRIY